MLWADMSHLTLPRGSWGGGLRSLSHVIPEDHVGQGDDVMRVDQEPILQKLPPPLWVSMPLLSKEQSPSPQSPRVPWFTPALSQKR